MERSELQLHLAAGGTLTPDQGYDLLHQLERCEDECFRLQEDNSWLLSALRTLTHEVLPSLRDGACVVTELHSRCERSRDPSEAQPKQAASPHTHLSQTIRAWRARLSRPAVKANGF